MQSDPLRAAAAGALVFFGLQFTPCSAHEDREFQISADGTLLGYPEEYGPAAVLVAYTGFNGQAAPATVTIRTGGHELRLPQCLSSLFVLPEGQEMRAHGSWYHRFDRLPPYLVVDLPTNSQDTWVFDGHTLLFNMRNAELIEARAQTVENLSEGSFRFHENKVVAAYCDEVERELLKRTPNSAGTALVFLSALLAVLALAFLSNMLPKPRIGGWLPSGLAADDAWAAVSKRAGWSVLAAAIVLGLLGLEIRELLVAASDIPVLPLIFFPAWVLVAAMVPVLALADELHHSRSAPRTRGLRSGATALACSLAVTLLGLGVYACLTEPWGMGSPDAQLIAPLGAVVLSATWLGLRVRRVPMRAYWLVVGIAVTPLAVLFTPVHAEPFFEWLPDHAMSLIFLTYPLLAGAVIHVSASWVSSSFTERGFIRLALAALLWGGAAIWLAFSSLAFRRWWPF